MEKTKQLTGYDKYVNWKILIVPVILFFAVLFMPTPNGMKDVGMEYKVAPTLVIDHFTRSLFEKSSSDAQQWELLTAKMMEQNMRIGALNKKRFLARNMEWCKKYKIEASQKNFDQAHAYVKENIPDEPFLVMMQAAMDLRKDGLKYENLSEKDRQKADKGAWHIKVAIAMGIFVVGCFLTECIPLPAVSFCIGLILVFTGVISRKEVVMLYWSDACWFIMGSLMFAAAFVKTGVDKRVCMMMFKKLAVPNVKWITLIFFLIIAPLAAFISDHALAAMAQLKTEIDKMGAWNRQQIWALIIFIIMVFGWFTEKAFFNMGIYPIRLGIGVIAVAGAVGYILTGVVNWRDYQERVDWGVVWLYAGAIIFGRTLDSTGAAYWLARSVIDLLAPLGMEAGVPLMIVSNGMTAILTNLMADGPAAAAVGPITLNMAGLVHPGTTFLPFMAMSTAIASSFAYCLVIGTPPNAIVYASGYLEPKDFLRVGIPMFFIANIVLIFLTAVYWIFRGFGGLPGF